MNWLWFASNARILLGVAVGAFAMAAMITGRIGIGSPISVACLAVAAVIIADPVKVFQANRNHEADFRALLDRNPDMKARVERGRQLVMLSYALYVVAAIWGLISGYSDAPFLLFLVPFLPAVGLQLKGTGEVAAVEGEFIRDSSPSE